MNQKLLSPPRKETPWLIWCLWITLWLEVSYICCIFLLLLLIGLLFDDDGTPFIQIVLTFGLGAFIPVVAALVGMRLDNWFYKKKSSTASICNLVALHHGDLGGNLFNTTPYSSGTSLCSLVRRRFTTYDAHAN